MLRNLRAGPPGGSGEVAGQEADRGRVPVADGGMRGIEQLEVHGALARGVVRSELAAEGFGTEVEEPVVAGARIDPDGAQAAERIGVPVDHPNRVPGQPTVP